MRGLLKDWMARGGESEQEGREKSYKNIAPLPSVAHGGKKKTYRTNQGRSGQEERKAGERESRLKGWRREEEKETVLSHAHPVCQPLHWALGQLFVI